MSNAALHVARTGLDAQNMRMQVIANNLANVNTTGFKRDRASFETLAYQAMTAPGAASSESTKFATGTNLGTGVQINGTAKIQTQGALQETGNPLDMAIQGDGYFQVLLPDGRTGYTRDGNFNRSDDGTIVTADGYQLQPQIQIPENTTNLTIAADGTVSATQAGETSSTELGKIELARFSNPAGLQAEGNNILTETAASGQPQTGPGGIDGRGTIQQSSLESSNVNIVEELVDMIETQRAYEVNSKMISSTDQMLQYVNQNL
ncbi:flagellar basal-body rod protein FlgG [Sphingomonas histidinilytica]|jgi:flagellar basal-body rod protein FlgG|uniref:Flagellar basal-body rod protein FlgG n=1 Tax=Rhizorhabdus histidinilytica TaxID=439228 RepID=A0A1T5BZI0_9SPHN|nr:flagellar basal-body rod protein FlgG [Rhizorhabdus histidinilytica]MBO9375226.1 flagellar basal-body rod protein FlgG [Rhizorhabdus histidinilytica]QEH77395.1 flagellar basal-body rod protein FlgG [Sphingomonas sp. C8-2]SKB52567.1 flagellar basal-body rod protein FlgG [Rhizorhabdus histidinilytica]